MSEKKKKGKFSINAFDVFIVILVLALIATVVYKAIDVVKIGSVDDNKEYSVIFKLEEEYNSLEKYLKSGDSVYVSSNGMFIGNLEYYLGEELLYEISEADNSAPDTENQIPDYYKSNYYGKIKMSKEAYKNSGDDYITVEGFNFAKGGELVIRTDKTEFSIKVIDIIETKK